MPFLELLPWGIILCPAYLLVRGSICGARPLVSFSKGVQGIRRPLFIYTGYPRGYSHSCKTHHPSLSMVINCDVVNKDQTFVTYISTPYLSFSCGPYFFVSFP